MSELGVLGWGWVAIALTKDVLFHCASSGMGLFLLHVRIMRKLLSFSESFYRKRRAVFVSEIMRPFYKLLWDRQQPGAFNWCSGLFLSVSLRGLSIVVLTWLLNDSCGVRSHKFLCMGAHLLVQRELSACAHVHKGVSVDTHAWVSSWCLCVHVCDCE